MIEVRTLTDGGQRGDGVMAWIVDFVSAWYLPDGITFAFILLVGPRFLPVVLALEAGVGFAVHREAPAIWTIVPMIVVAGYGLAAMAVHWGRAGFQLTSPRDVFWIGSTTPIPASPSPPRAVRRVRACS